MFFDITSPWRNCASSARVSSPGRDARRSRLRLRRRARVGLLGIDHLIERLEDRKLLDASPIAHPTFIINNPVELGSLRSSSPSGFTPASPSGFTPVQIRKAYGIDSIKVGSITGDGTGQTVAIVDSYDAPNFLNSTDANYHSSLNDLHQFDQQFGLPDPPSFQKVNQLGQSGPLPGTDPNGPGESWEVEESLDVEWVHSIAPQASIILVEANSDSDSDLLNGVANAAKLPGVSAVSMSFGGYEDASVNPGENGYFTTPSGHNGVTFLAATGDDGAPGLYPAFSPNVVAVGGTSLFLNPDNSYNSESGWYGSGGGVSARIEPQPAYQSGLPYSNRSIPDVSFDADPDTGVAVYDSYDFGADTPWMQIGGTSLSSPCWAGLIAITNQLRMATGGTTLDGPTQTLPALYKLYSDPAKYSSDFNDITSGFNGFYFADTGYDLVTGIGAPIANRLVPDLAALNQNGSPTVVTPASATPSPVTGTTTTLSVLGTDDGGEANLTYTWAATTLPSGASAPTFSANGTNVAKQTVATFSKAGTYGFTVTIADTAGLTTTSSVNVAVNQSLTSIAVSPASVTVKVGGTQQFTATAKDQFGNALATQPSFTWVATAGTITTGGLFTAPKTTGNVTVTATSGSFKSSASVNVTNSVLNLQDQALAKLVQSLDADGSISRLDMIQILRSIGSEDGVVDAAEFGDLKTILNNAAMLKIPGYVQVLAGDVVNGNPANAYFQGQVLGNLAAGSSASQLNELVGKWFLGADHPAAYYYDQYGLYHQCQYSSVAGSLFVNGPVYTDMHQGDLGDCYLIAALGSLAKSSPAVIQNMIVDDGDNTWTVRFYANGTPDYVTVDRMLPTENGNLVFDDYGASPSNAGNELWIPLVEKAYAEWNETGKEGRDDAEQLSQHRGRVIGQCLHPGPRPQRPELHLSRLHCQRLYAGNEADDDQCAQQQQGGHDRHHPIQPT